MRFIDISRRVALAVAVASVAACTQPAGTGEDEQNVISTDLAAYASGDNIVVNYSGMQGADQSDWIAIALTTDASDEYETFQYTGGAQSGMMTFTAPSLATGTYEARAYYDWQHTFSYTIQQTSPSFTWTNNATAPTSVTTDKALYTAGATVTLDYAGMPGNKYDWVGIAVAGAPVTQVVAWDYTNGAISGTQAFAGLASGNYEARAYRDNQYELLASSTFTIGGATAVSTDKTVYSSGDTVTLSYSGMPGNANDYVAVALQGSAPGTYVGSAGTGGAVNGSAQFPGLPNGSYTAEAYAGGTTTILASSNFTISNSSSTTLTTDSTTYAVGQTVTVTFMNSGANASDQIGIAIAGSPDTSYVTYKNTGGTVNGTVQFTGLPAGTYQARFYPDASFNISARSPNFTVGGTTCTTPTQSPVLGGIQSGTLTMGSAAQSVSALLTADNTTSILFFTVAEDEKSPDHGSVICELHDDDVNLGSAGVTCLRNDVGTDETTSTGVISIHYDVVTFTSGVTVQRGIVDTGAGNPASVTLTSIDPTSSFVVLGGQVNGGTGWGTNEFIQAQITGATTLQIAADATSTNAAWQVVSMTGASVQRGTTSFATGATTATSTITSTPSGSMVLASYTTDNPSGVDASEIMMQASLADAQTIDFSRQLGGTNLGVAYEVVSLPFATHTGVASFGTGVTNNTGSVPGIVAATSIVFGGSQAILGQSCGSTAYAGADGDLVGEACATMTTSADTVTFTRATATSTATIPWTVIDFAHNCAGN
jgi:hypothetical protein